MDTRDSLKQKQLSHYYNHIQLFSFEKSSPNRLMIGAIFGLALLHVQGQINSSSQVHTEEFENDTLIEL